MLKEKTVTTTCSYDCGGRCLLEVHVANGKVTKIKSKNAQGLNIKACPRGIIQKDVLYNPDRLKDPLKRTGERGSKDFESISWDEALDIIAERIKYIIKKYGTESIYFILGSGSLATLNNVRDFPRRFFSMLGRCTSVWGGASFEGASQSSLATFGTINTGSTRDNILYSKFIILWGWNPSVTRFGSDTSYYLGKAKKSGAKIISVDPRKNQSAKSLADQWIPIKPGTDTAMLIAMAYVLINEKLYDVDFIRKHTYGFKQYRDYILGKEDGIKKSPEWASSICGVSTDTIRDITREYAKNGPAALITGWAPGRTAYGEQFHRAASVLAAMTGNIGNKGGFVSGGTDMVDLGLIDEEIPIPDAKHHLVHNTELYDALIHGTAGGYPADCNLLYIIGANLFNQYLNLNKGKQALQMQDFIVVHELFLTPTARFADIVLPVTHYLEQDDIGFPWMGGPYTIFMNRAVKPIPGPRSDLKILTGISKKIAINDFNDKTDEKWLEEIFDGQKYLPDLNTFRKMDIYRLKNDDPFVAFEKEIKDPEKYPFPTPSGKIEIFSSRFDKLKNPLIPPVPKYIPAWEGPDDEKIKDYPIQFITPHSKARINSQLDNIKGINGEKDDYLWMNPLDADKRDIKSGDLVYVFNDRGRLKTKVKVTGEILQGTASLDQGTWYDPDEKGIDNGGNVNVLTLDKMSPAGAFTSNTCLVEIRKI